MSLSILLLIVSAPIKTLGCQTLLRRAWSGMQSMLDKPRPMQSTMHIKYPCMENVYRPTPSGDGCSECYLARSICTAVAVHEGNALIQLIGSRQTCPSFKPFYSAPLSPCWWQSAEAAALAAVKRSLSAPSSSVSV